jgi:aspartate racemase
LSRTVGIIGGLGPQATVDLFARIVALTPASHESEHLHILVDNQPAMPDRHAAIAGRGPSAAPNLIAVAQNLVRAGAELLVMPCHTAHHYAPDIRAAVDVPMIDMIDQTAAAIAAVPGIRNAGLLAAQGCIDAGLYQRALAKRGIAITLPDTEELHSFMRTVFAVKADGVGQREREAMRAIGRALAERGAEVIVAACSEVPLLVGRDDFDCPFLDATDVLARATVAMALSDSTAPLE